MYKINKEAIGVFDSGLGGLTLVKEIKRILPHEDIMYLGDTARVPYGTRSREIVQKFALEDANFLLKKGVKCIVVACNTASALSYDYLKEKVDLPVIDVVSTLSKIEDLKKYKKIGIIGTSATIKSGAHRKLIENLNPKASVSPKACPLFVPLIEAGEARGELLNLVIRKYLSDFKNKGFDSLILGCTHYPIIKDKIGDYLNGVKLIDPAVSTASALNNFLRSKNMLNSESHKPSCSYFVTDIGPQFEREAEMFLGEELTGLVQKVDLDL